MAGISLVVAFAALGGSLLGSIRSYLDDSLGSDYVVQPTQQTSDAGFNASLPDRVGNVEGVERTTSIVSSFRRSGEKVDIVFGVDGNYPGIFRTDFVPGTPKNAFGTLEEGGALIGKQLAESRNLGVGDSIKLAGPKGEKKYPIEGVLENDLIGGGSGVYLSKRILADDFNETESEFLAVKAERG